MGWCYHDGADIYVGDFNGDGKIANRKNNVNLSFSISFQSILSMFAMYFTGTKPYGGAITMALIFTWVITMEMAHTPIAIFIMICCYLHLINLVYWCFVFYRDQAMGWCHHDGADVYVGDFNRGVKIMDCKNNINFWISLAFNESYLCFVFYRHQAMGWCYHDGADIYVGDFNGDGTDDIMCKDNVNLYLAM